MESNAENKSSSTSKDSDSDLAALLEKNPAVKLLDFFEGMLGEEGEVSNSLDIQETLKRSKKLRAVEGVKE